MTILLISDIHSNIVALETVLERAGPVEQVWCLGDVVGYGPAPNECIERLRALPLTCLAGNHDWAVLSKLELEDFNPDARTAIEWTQKVLTPQNYAWLGERPDRIDLPDLNLTLVHASPRAPIWEYIMSPSAAAENMVHFDTGLCFFGHTHLPFRYQLPPGGTRLTAAHLANGQPVTLTAKTLLNPGSVGQPRDRDPRAAFALYDSQTGTLTPHRVEYEISKTQAAMKRAKLPPRLIARLEYGM